MAFLIILVSGLALLAMTVATSVSSFSLEDFEAKYASARVDVGLLMLEGTVESYLRHSVDAEGRIIYPGDGVDLRMDLAPLHGYIPSDQLYDIRWSVRTGHYLGKPSVGICAMPLKDSAVIPRAIRQVAMSLPAPSVVLASDCFAQSGQAAGSVLTYWLEVSAFEQVPPVEAGGGEGGEPAGEVPQGGKGCNVNGNCFGHLKKPKPSENVEVVAPVPGYTGGPAMDGYLKSRKMRCDALKTEPRRNSNWDRMLKACIK